MRLALPCARVSILLLALAPPTHAVTFADGALHIIDSANSYPSEETIIVDGPGGVSTTVQVIDGGELGTGPFPSPGYPTRLFGSSLLTIDVGGELYSVLATDNARVSVSGQVNTNILLDGSSSLDVNSGLIRGSIFSSYDSSVRIDRGCFCGVEARDNASIQLSRGGLGVVRGFNSATFEIFSGTVSSFALYDDTAAWISGIGTGDPTRSPVIGYLDLFGSASLQMTGGSIYSRLYARDSTAVVISGGDVGPSLTAAELSTIEIYGSSFNFPLGDLPVGSAQLTGILADGTAISTTYGRSATARITLVPEPGTAALLGLGLLGVAVVVRRKRP